MSRCRARELQGDCLVRAQISDGAAKRGQRHRGCEPMRDKREARGGAMLRQHIGPKRRGCIF